MPSLSYTFLENTCPAKNAMTFEQLTFWTLGYGGWLGVALMPLIWCMPASKTLRASLSILALPTCALVLTALFSVVYLVALFTYHTSAVMISPQFLHSSISIICLSVGGIGLYMAGNKEQVVQKESEAESDSDNESDASDASDASEATDSTETTQDEPETAPEAPDNTWRETANFEGLRTASPLPE